MAMIEVEGADYRYGRVQALRALDLAVPEGALYALVGPNGAGKTTLLQVLAGLRRPQGGRARVNGIGTMAIRAGDRARITYVAEGQVLPGWMRLDQLDAYVAPLYPGWDAALARDLAERFRLDPTRPIKTLSRGQRMKVALRCALAPRPKVVLMDEPFSGMDALVKDELVGGLLDSARSEGWTILLSSHDISELEMLADWTGFLSDGRMVFSEAMESLLTRMKRVEVLGIGEMPTNGSMPAEWTSVERAGGRLTFLVTRGGESLTPAALSSRFPGSTHIEVRRPTLREVFVAVAKEHLARPVPEAAR
jgi:ABC-type multidrug transport system ATPase subunit